MTNTNRRTTQMSLYLESFRKDWMGKDRRLMTPVTWLGEANNFPAQPGTVAEICVYLADGRDIWVQPDQLFGCSEGEPDDRFDSFMEGRVLCPHVGSYLLDGYCKACHQPE